MSLPARALGPFTVSAVSLGCMNLSHAYYEDPGEAAATRLLNAALDAGVTMLDTAAIYGDGANEALIGRAVGHRRHEYVLASKCVLAKIGEKRVLDGRPETIRATCEAALHRLGTDVIDLYYLHRLDAAVPIEESVGALADLVAAGKIRAIGLSEMSAETIARAHAVHAVAAVQSEYSLAVRNPEVAVLEFCARAGIGFVAFSPLSRGLLADALAADEPWSARDIRRAMPRFVGDAFAHNLALAARLASLAAAAGCSPAQLALAWVLAQAPHIVALPGTRDPAHLHDDLGAAALSLDAGLLAELDRLFPANAARGPRYAAPLQAQVDTELLPGEQLA